MKIIHTTDNILPIVPGASTANLQALPHAAKHWSNCLSKGMPLTQADASILATKWPTYWSIAEAASLECKILIGTKTIGIVTVTSIDDDPIQLLQEQAEGLTAEAQAQLDLLIEFITGYEFTL